MITREIDASRLRERFYELREALIGQGKAGDAATLVEDESRLFCRQVVVATPPYGLGSASRNQGEKAVRGDLKKIFTPVEDEMLQTIGSQFGVANIDHWITTASGKRLRLDWQRLDPTGQGMKAFHRKNRNRYGRTGNLNGKASKADTWFSAYVISKKDFADYKNKILARVGRRKAAWAKSFVAMGGTVQRWIAKHLDGAKGHFFSQLTGNNPTITMSSSAAGVAGDEHIIQSALKIRYQSIGRRIRLITSGYAKDVASGIKISRKLRRTPAGSL